MSLNQIDYISKYNKENYKMYQFRVKKSDRALIEKLDNTHNRNRYITSLILEDIRPSVLTIKQIKEIIKPIMERHEIKDIYLFGFLLFGQKLKYQNRILEQIFLLF